MVATIPPLVHVIGVPLDLASITNQTYVAAKAAFGGAAQSPMIAKLLAQTSQYGL